MLSNVEVISLYENVSRITAEMLEAAREQDWEQLNSLESQCTQEVSILKTKGPATPLFGAFQTRKIEILQKILRDDRDIRAATQPWMNELQVLLNGGSQYKLAPRYSGS